MIPNPWVLVVFGAILIATALGSFHVGQVYERAGFIEADLKRADKVIVQEKIVEREVPKIVERVVVKTETVEKEVERVVTKIPELLSPDCVLPDDYGVLLVAAARGIDPTTGDVDALRGTYGCRETLDATLRDLRAGWRNSARLDGLQEWARLVTAAPPTAKGESP